MAPGRRFALLAAAVLVLAAAGWLVVRRNDAAPSIPPPPAPALAEIRPTPPAPPPGVVVREVEVRPLVAQVQGLGGKRTRGQVRWLPIGKSAAGVVADVRLEGLAPGAHKVALDAAGDCASLSGASPSLGVELGEVVANVRGQARGRMTLADATPASLLGQAFVVRDAKGQAVGCGVVAQP